MKDTTSRAELLKLAARWDAASRLHIAKQGEFGAVGRSPTASAANTENMLSVASAASVA